MVEVQPSYDELTRRCRVAEAQLAALQSSELVSVLESISDAFFALDDDLVVTYFNAEAAQLLGRQAVEVVGKPLFDAFPEARGSIFEEKYREAIQTKRPGSFETYFDVPPFRNWYEVRVYPRTQGISVYFLVTTARKQAEEALRISEEKLSLFFALVPDMVCTASTAGYFQMVNQAWEAVLGYTREELMSRPFAEFIHPDDLDATFAEVARQLAGLQTAHFINRYRCKDGKYRWLEWTATSAQGDTLYAAARDITERKQAEEALRQSEARWRSYIEHAPYAVYLVDETGKYCDVNPEACRSTGYTEAELLAMHISDLLMPEFLQEGLALFQHLLETGTMHGELLLKLKSGEARWVSISAVQLSATRFLGFTQDIHEHKQAVARLRENEERLRRLFSILPVGVTIIDGHRQVVDTNPAITRLLDFTDEELRTGQYARRQYLDRDGQPMPHDELPSIRAMQTHEAVHEVEVGVVKENGEIIWTQVSAAPLDDGGVVLATFDITAHKMAAEALRRNIAKYDNMMTNIGDVIVIIDQDGIVRYKSPNIERIFGWKPEEVVGVSAIDNVHPDDRGIAEQFIGSLLRKANASGSLECRYRCKDGSYKWIHFTGVNLLDDLDIHGMLGNYQDITERKLSEEALRESERKYRNLFDNIQVGMFRTKLDGSALLDCNDYFLNIFEHTREEMVGNPAVMHWANPAEREEMVRRLQRDGAVSDFECRMVTKYGGIKYCLTTVRAFLDEGLMEGSVIDISARKLAEAYREIGTQVLQQLNEPGDLHAALQRVLAIVKTQTGVDAVGIRLQDGEDFPYHIQEGLSDDFLLLENSLIERNAEGGVCRDGDGHPSLECTCGLVICGKTVPEHPLFTAGGSFWTNDSVPLLDIPLNEDPRHHPRNNCIHHGYASVALVPIRDTERIIGLIHLNDRRPGCFTRESIEILEGMATHIGAAMMRKQAEAEQAKLEAQLRQAQKMESVGRLAGGVAHDFNNMLGVILGNAEMALAQLDPADPVTADLREITQAAQRSAELTRQLLAFARKQTVAPKVLDVNQTITGIYKMLLRLIGEDIELAWNPGAELWPVNIDPSQIDQMLANLCVNARDAIGGVGKITIETQNITLDAGYSALHTEALPGAYVLLAVSDNGCGMDADTLQHLFEPFFTTKGVGEGTGLGLATVYGIVKQNHGVINVYSEPALGTTFKIYLPRYAGSTAHPNRDRAAVPVPRGKETVLLVEDEPSILELGKRMLELVGYQVLAAKAPGEALRLAAEYTGDIHLLMTDVVMPEMHGRELAQRLLVLYPKLKRLFMSGYTADVIAHHGVLDAGVNFLQKPFTMKDLTAKVRTVLDE